ncbi:Predicted arabinose efflux permease, MFS family [Cnuella takakiae]|uniref:Predicted arabinose efflux permease, MFS family n=1 Tax=Cnuella takakiae TaxID=1302690 RepID=A0A1M5ICJ4_9BACT|nr:MFS transporter [Cnuella takakiae]OLY90799.1 MFS transporter [Cnuella takakiae]SHG25955.1 Predicted arabinose efflux permease, MFS family [Cnuella takakiae]
MEQLTLKPAQVLFMAFCTGLIVANIYYCQPLVVLISREFGVAESKAGIITFFTQLGYALGLLFFVPLGDMLEKRKHIVVTTALAVCFLVMAAMSVSLPMLCAASLLIGATSIVPQLILPLAAHWAPAHNRGKVIGIVMSGLLIGILLSRTISGLVGNWLGWRSMFWIAAAISAVLMVLMARLFPRTPSHFKGHYGTLMRSLVTLVKEQPVLREAAAINALTFSSFGLFWTTMVLHLSQPPFGYSAGTIGLFGLAAVLGALIAPVIGGKADKGNPRVAIGYGLSTVVISYILFYFFGASVVGMVIGIILLDLGQQSVHVSNQTRVYALLPEARNRLNTVYMTVSFIGTALGSAIGLWVWEKSGWTGVCITGLLFLAGAFAIYALTWRHTPHKVIV